jgi:hypothetical protein
MHSSIAANLLQYKTEYYGTITLRKPVIIARSFQIADKHNLWLIPMDEFVKPHIPAVILICHDKPRNPNKVNEINMT